MRRLGVVAAVALLAACSAGGDPGGGGDGVQLPGGADLSTMTLAGLGDGAEPVAFGELLGTPVVVNFFASTCAPCVAEMPAIERVKQAAGEAVTFVGVATNDRVEDALALAERTGVTWALAADPDGSFIRAVGGVALPTTALVGTDGVVVHVSTGELDEDELVELLAEYLDVQVTAA